MRFAKFIAPWLALALLCLPAHAGSPAPTAPGIVTAVIANDGSTGTTANALAKITSGGAAIIAGISDTDSEIGIVVGGAGTAGSAVIIINGTAQCAFDGTATNGHFVGISSSVAGDCHDVGATRPTSGQIIGFVLAGGSGAATYTVAVQMSAPTGGGTGTVTSVATGNGLSGGTITTTGTLSAHVDGSTITDSGGPLVVANTTVGGATCTPGSSCTPESVSVARLDSGSNSLSTSTTNFFFGGTTAASNVIAGTWPVGGTFSNFNAAIYGAPGAGKSYAFTLFINGSSTNIACTISGASATTCSDSSHAATILAGQTIYIQSVPSGTPQASAAVATLQFQTP